MIIAIKEEVVNEIIKALDNLSTVYNIAFTLKFNGDSRNLRTSREADRVEYQARILADVTLEIPNSCMEIVE